MKDQRAEDDAGGTQPEEGSSVRADLPNVARMWDYYLGGTDNLQADRDAARAVLGAAPDVPLAALENREFLKHAIRFLAEDAGVNQFIDIGPGLPTQGNVHELARQHAENVRVIYADSDPIVVSSGHAKVSYIAGVEFIAADIRNPRSILDDPVFRQVIDLTKPVAVCATLVLQFVSEDEDPYGVMAELSAAICPGSYLVVSHVTGDGRDDGSVDLITDVYEHASAPLIMRSREQIARFFTGFDLVSPGLVFLSQWRPGESHYAGGGTRWAYAAVGKKAPLPD
jgi:hypothetical protein